MTIDKIYENQEFDDRFSGRYFGMYRAIVKDINDPEQLGRIKVQCIDIYGESQDDLSPWCWPCQPYGGFDETGFFFIPEVESGVWIMFEQGLPSHPVWVGCWWGKPSGNNELPNKTIAKYGKHKIIKTKTGHTIEFIDEAGNEEIIITEGKGGAYISLKNGVITLKGKTQTSTII